MRDLEVLFTFMSNHNQLVLLLIAEVLAKTTVHHQPMDTGRHSVYT